MAFLSPMTEKTDQLERLHAIVMGTVQGVNFRYATLEQARRLKVKGWVKNLSDGSVEVTAEGPRPTLNQLLAFLRHGPPAATVKDVRESWQTATGEFRDFSLRW